MFTTNEQELSDYALNNAIVAFRIIETNTGKYNLTFSVTWKKDGDCILTTARKDLRKWTSVNNLIEFIKKLQVPAVPISIHPYYKQED